MIEADSLLWATYPVDVRRSCGCIEQIDASNDLDAWRKHPCLFHLRAAAAALGVSTFWFTLAIDSRVPDHDEA